MSRKKRKEREEEIIRELAQKEYKRMEELKKNGDYEQIEISQMRAYNHNVLVPSTFLIVSFILLVFSVLIFSMLTFQKNLEEDGVTLGGIFSNETIVTVQRGQSDLVIQDYPVNQLHNNHKPISVIKGKGTEIKDIPNNTGYVVFNLGDIDGFTLDSTLELILTDNNNKEISTKVVPYSKSGSSVVYIPTNAKKIQVKTIDPFQWEISYNDRELIKDIPVGEITKFEGVSVFTNVDSCVTLSIKPIEPTFIDYSTYYNSKYRSLNVGLIEGKVDLFNKLEVGTVVTFYADNTVELICTK